MGVSFVVEGPRSGGLGAHAALKVDFSNSET